MADQVESSHNVISVSFDDDEKAYTALTNLKQLDAQSQLDLRAAAVIVRQADGQVTVKDEVDDKNFPGAATGGIIGLLIGILFGPFGVLIGGATGLLVGALYDADDDEDTESVLSDLARSAAMGRTILLADVNEPSADVVDAAMTSLQGHVVRRPVTAVEAEIAAAEAAQKAARKEARKVLREQRMTQAKDQIQEKIERLKEKLHIGKSPAHA